MSKATGANKPSESQKGKALLAMKAAEDRGEEYYDPARKEDILERTKTRLELWEEHLKDPMIALEKASLLGLASGSKLPVASRVGCNGCSCAGGALLGRRLALPGPVGQCALARSVHLLDCSWVVWAAWRGHFFFLVKKELVVASNDVSSNPFVSAETLNVCTDWSTPFGSRR